MATETKDDSKKLSERTSEIVGEMLENLFEANIVPNVARNIATEQPEMALAYLLGAQDALNTLKTDDLSLANRRLRRNAADLIKSARTLIKKEVR